MFMTLIAQHVCCSLLGIDPKTLRRWLTLAQICWLPHPSDARCRCLTPAHLQYLAAIHQRPLTASLTEEAPLPDPHLVDETNTANIDEVASSSSIFELREQVSQLQTTITTLQQQLTQLTLDLLHERAQPVEHASSISQAPLASPPPTQEKIASSSSQKPSHSRKGRPRELVPLIESTGSGSYVIISPHHGQLFLKPESREWFAWLETLSSFRFVGEQGRLSTNRKSGRSSWMAYRRIHGHCSSFSLGPTEQITLARLEHMASILQSAGSSPKP
jgi:hypothetical protein